MDEFDSIISLNVTLTAKEAILKLMWGSAVLFMLMCFYGCSPTVKVKHEVEPIYITVDVNIKVQKELDSFFDFEDEPAKSSEETQNEG